MKQVQIIAYYTFKELLKSRILMNVFFIGCGMLLLSYLASRFTYGVPGRVAIDFGLGTLTISSVAIALFLGVDIIYSELETRTIYMLISRPVSRASVLLGKYIGFISILVLNLILLSLMSVGSFLLLGGEMSGLIWWNLVYILVEAILVLLLVVFFSLNTNKIISVISTLVLYLVGHAIEPSAIQAFVKDNSALETILKGYHFLLPGFYKLNIKDFVLYEETLSSAYLFSTLFYGLLYIAFLVVTTTLVFNKKDLN
jgi:ABC-2 type transport system permease protein